MAWGCLGLFVSSLAWVRVLVVLLVATLDGSHSTWISGHGSELRVVLHHSPSSTELQLPGDRSSGHCHALGASVLVVFAENSSEHQDHVLDVRGISQVVSFWGENLKSGRMAQELLSPSAIALTLPAGRLVSGSGLDPRPPPNSTATLEQLRSTQLLI